MAGPGVFHVEFGINETELTRCLEDQRYQDADRLICDNSYSSYLDEGCYQRTPLYISLCGVDEEEREGFRRNLYIARLLAKYGAAINYRIPTTFYGCEYMGPGKSGLELVVEMFNTLTLHQCHINNTDSPADSESVSSLRVIGLDKQPVDSREDLLQQLLDLTFILLTHGGDSNIRDEFRQTLLHRTAVFSADPRMLYQLCESSTNPNPVDIRGNTPLGALCDAFPLGVDNFLEMLGVATDPYAHHCHINNKQHFLDYLLCLDGVEVNNQNILGRTALFNCMLRGDIISAGKLLDQGCDSSLRGQVKEGTAQTRSISPLFASLCSSRVITSHVNKYISNTPTMLQWLAHLVDKGHFSHPTIIKELHTYIDTDFPEFHHLKRFHDNKLLHLMFGGVTSSLRQACTRKLFQMTFLSYHSSSSCLFDQADDKLTLGFYQSPDNFHIYLNEIITENVVENLVNTLSLPKDSLVYFEVELFRQRLASRFRQFQWFKYYDEAIDGELGMESDDFSTGENDSDLEYW